MTSAIERRSDYSQHAQALIIEQLITPDTPRIVIDVGAHDGLVGSNSRRLLEEGWRGILVEPVPSVFELLRQNCSGFEQATLVQAACSDRKSTARIRIGRDGAHGQMSSLSSDPMIAANLTGESVEVQTTTLAGLVAEHHIPADFGILLVDTEGWDLTVLRGLEHMKARPRIIVTEEFAATDQEKYALLRRLGYKFAGVWGSDSFWISPNHTADAEKLQLPVHRLPNEWLPPGEPASGARASIDHDPYSRGCIVGWVCTPGTNRVEPNVAVMLQKVNSPQRYGFLAWRTPRPDVADYYRSPDLVMAGYRAPIDVPPGEYEIRVIQFGDQVHTDVPAGRLSFRDAEIRNVEYQPA